MNDLNDRLVLFHAYPGMGLLDLSGPMTVFSGAAQLCRRDGKPGYSIHIASIDGGDVRTAEGATIGTEPVGAFADTSLDTLILPGGADIDPVVADGRLTEWLRTNAPRARRVASLCSGAFLLADAGLLEGRRAVTHWAHCDVLRERYPSISVEPDAIFVQDGAFW